MTEQVWKRIGTDFETKIPDPPLRFLVKDLHETRGQIFASIHVFLDAGKTQAEILRDRLEITSGREKAYFARRLVEVMGAGTKWPHLIEKLLNQLIDQYQAGPKCLALVDIEDVSRPAYLINPLLPLNEPMVLYGDGGSAKSLTAVLLGLVVSGSLFLPGLGIETPSPVLFLDWETDAGVIAARARKLVIAHGGKLSSNFFYCRMTRSLVSDLPAVQRLVDQTHSQLVIVDSIAPACDGEPESAETILRFFNALRHLNCTKLVNAHIPKAIATNKGAPLYPFGSVFARNLARSLWAVVRDPSSDSQPTTRLSVTLHHTKANDDYLHHPIGLRYQFGERWIRVDVTTHEARSQPAAESESLQLLSVTSLSGQLVDAEEMALRKNGNHVTERRFNQAPSTREDPR